jgi:hypothetical protein
MLKMKSTLLSLWNVLDPIYYSFTRLTYVEEKKQKNAFRVRLTRYKGAETLLSDGTIIQKNDLLLKIHLHNCTLLKELAPTMNELIKTRTIYRTVEKSMPGLAAYIINHPEFHQIKGIVGITMLNRGCKELGFETFPISSKFYKFYKLLTLFPIYLLSVARPFKGLKKHAPIYLFMSKSKLLKLYSSSPTSTMNYR